MSVYGIQNESALALAIQEFIGPSIVKLVAVDFNWGPPISGRADTDFFNIWAMSTVNAQGNLYLQGKDVNSNWDINAQFTYEGTHSFQNARAPFSFYSLSVSNTTEYPIEFVLRYDTTTGEQYYDNNGGQNFQVSPYKHHGGSAIVTTQAIFNLGEIQNYNLFMANP